MRRTLPILLALLLLTGCTVGDASPKGTDTPPPGDIPLLDVWVVEENALVRMDVESYVACVVAG